VKISLESGAVLSRSQRKQRIRIGVRHAQQFAVERSIIEEDGLSRFRRHPLRRMRDVQDGDLRVSNHLTNLSHRPGTSQWERPLENPMRTPAPRF
jgi:hypothetical protein